jgi:hypothetical protein
MKLLVATTLVAWTSIASADISIMDNDQTIEVDCAKDKQVSVVGNHATVTLTGTCTKVSISGNHATLTGAATTVWIAGNQNTATLSGVDTLMVAGNENTVSYKGPITAKSTKVKAPGSKNTITKQK